MPNKPRRKDDDWYKSLESGPETNASASKDETAELNREKREINVTALQELWKIWLKFNRSNIHFSIRPEYGDFLKFREFPEEWTLREDFRFQTLNSVELKDRTSHAGRMGDALKLFYYTQDGRHYVRLVFEYFEGERYHKYSGWKRRFGQFVLYDAPVSSFAAARFRDIVADIVKPWYESHLSGGRDNFLEHLKANYPAGTPFSE